MSVIVGSRLAELQSSVAAKRSAIGSPRDMFAAIYQEKLGAPIEADQQINQSNLAVDDAWEMQQYLSEMIAGSGNYDYQGSGTVTEYEDYIQEAARTYGVNPALIKSVIECESSFNPNAVSSAGAVGLMQLMPATAKELGVTNSRDPKQNIMGGTKYLADLVKNFDGDLRLALSGYNMGGNAVKKKGITPNTTNMSDYNILPSGVLAYANKVISGMSKY